MEPFSIIGTTLLAKCTLSCITESVFTGWVGNRADDILANKLPDFAKRITNQFGDTKKPINHDLQKAILSSHWFATKVFCEELKKNNPADIFNTVLDVASKQIRQINDSKFTPVKISPDAYQADFLILKDKESNASEILKNKVIDFHLQDLRGLLKEREVASLSFETLENTIKNNLANLDWFELVCAFLNEFLKGDNNKAKDAFQNQELAKIGLEVAEIKQVLAGFELNAKGFVNSIGEQRFEEFKAFLKEDLAEIKGNLVEIREVTKETNEVVKQILKNQEEVAYKPKPNQNLTPIPTLGTFIGREADLKCLSETLEKANQVVLVNGIGGIGKTTLAKAYIHQNHKDFDHIAWISVIGTSIKEAFVNTTYDNDDLKNAQLTQGDNDARFWAIMRALRQTQGEKNLLVIDNAETDIDEISDELPTVTHWRILLTSRDNLDGYTELPLDELSPKDALALFKQYYTGNETDEELHELLEAINYHTLTIELLAKTLEKSDDDFNLEELLDKLNNRQLDDEELRKNIKTEHWNAKQTQLFKHLLATFELSNKTDYEIWALKQFTALPPEPQPIKQLKEWLKIDESNKNDFNKAIEDLHTEGWLKRTRNEKKETCYTLHRLIQDMVHYQHPIAFEDIESLVNTFEALLDFDTSTNFPTKFPYLAPAEYILNALPYDLENNAIALLNNNIGVVYRYFADLRKAAKYLEKSLKIRENQNDETNIATTQSNLALVLKDLGDYEGAKDLLEKAKKSAEKNFGEEHPTTAVRYSNLALVLKDLGDYEGAKDLLEKAKKSDEKNFGEEHPNTAVSYSNLALVLKDLGDYEGAKDLLEKAKKSDEKNFGEEHPTTAVRYSNLALVLQDLGDYEGAKDLLEKAKKSDEKNFGEEHPSTAVRYSNLALVLKDLGDYEGAKDLLEKAKKSAEKNFGEEHPTTALRQWNLASVLVNLERYQEAYVLLSKASNTFNARLGLEHPYSKNCHGWLVHVESLLKVMYSKIVGGKFEKRYYIPALSRRGSLLWWRPTNQQ